MPPQNARVQLLIAMAGLALFLYPATMGLSYLDPYQLGYAPRPLIAVVGVLALGLLLLNSKRHREMRQRLLEIRHLRQAVIAKRKTR